MAITITNKPADPTPTPAKEKRTNGHQRPASITPEALSVDMTRVRVKHFLALLGGLSASGFYERLKKGTVPQPCGHDPRPYWRAAVVRDFLSK